MVYREERTSKSSDNMTGSLVSSSSTALSSVCGSNSRSSNSRSSNSNSKKCRSTPYLERVGEALSRALSLMEPFDDGRVSGESRRCFVMRPHVELGTAPVTLERIEDVQKIHRPVRPCGGSVSNPTPATPGSWNAQRSAGNGPHNARVAGGAKAFANANPSVPVKSKPTPSQSCLIEATSNSVRISFLFKAQAKAAATASAATASNQDPLEASILFQWMRFLMVQQQHPLLRKRPLEGYSVTFLVTNRHVAVHDRGGATQTIQEFILGFCSRVDKECSDIKLQVNAQARYVTTEFCKAFNQTTTSAPPTKQNRRNHNDSSGNIGDSSSTDGSDVTLANE